MSRLKQQNGFILLPVVLAIVLIATIAFLINTESAINVDMTASTAAAVEAEQLARAGLAHATWGAQNSGCAGDMGMTTVPFGQAGTDSYTATVKTPGGATTAYNKLTADQDTWITSDNPTQENGGSGILSLRRESGNLEYAVVRFDLSALPAGAQINSAVARFYVKGGKGHPAGPVTVHRVTADWTETGATWETTGDKFDSATLDTIPAQPDAGDVWVRVNLTAQVQAWVNGGESNYGIMLIPTGEGTHAEYSSREGAASEQPLLDVVVGNGPATPATITATGTLTGNPSPANDITRALTRTAVPTYQPTGTLLLQPGPEGKDAMIYQWKPDWNYGANQGLDVLGSPSEDSDYHSLLQFNLGKIPYGAKIYSAQLALYQNNNGSWGGPVGVRRITSDWVEGTGNGGTAAGVTWNNRDTGIPWSTPGGDFDTTALASTSIPAGVKDWFSWDITGLVAGWVSGTYPNHGLALVPDSSSTNTYFTSSDAADPTLHPKLTVTYACECGTPCIAPQGYGTVGMVVVNPTTPVPADAYKKALFESWGYTVNLIGENLNAAGYLAAAASNDVFFISETVNVGLVGVRLRDVPIGIVSQDGAYTEDLGFANGSAWPVGNAINITDTSHYITAPFPTGPLDIYTAGMEQLTVSGTEAPGLQALADTGGAGSLVLLEQGAALGGGVPGENAAGRRVMLPLGREGKFNWDYLNSNGQLLVQRALQWGTGNTGGPPKNLLLVVVDPSALTAQEATKKTLIESWGYTVNLIDESDSQANFDAAVAANDVAYIPQEITSANLGTKLSNAAIGVVNEEGEMVEELGISQGKLFKDRDQIDILDNTHYITQPFATGLLTFVSSAQSVHMLNGDVAPGLVTLGQSFNTGSLWLPSLAAIETGGELYGGGTAAGRRVELPWGGGTFDINQLTDDGRTLMQRAIDWAAEAGVPDTLPIAHWTFDEGSGPTAFDTVGGNDATLNGDTAWRTGTINGALGFDGSGDYIRTDNNFTPPPVGTVTFWMRVSGSPASHGRILGLDDTWEIRHVTTGTADGIPYGLVFDLGVTGVNTEFVTTTTVDMPGKWYHIAAAYDTNTDAYAVYIDGVPHKSGTYPSALTVPAANLLSMGTRTGSTNYFNGELDDVRVYNQFLSAAEIAELASGGGTQEEILLVVKDAASLTAQDIARQALMVDWGYRVTTISASDSQANFDAAVASADAAYVVEQQQSTALGTKLRDATIAVINEEAELRQDIGFSANRDWPSTRDTVDIIDNSHYITQPFATGLLSIASAPIEVISLSGQMAGGLQVLGQQDWGGPQNSLSVIDTGGDLYGGGTAAGRRVQLPWGRTGFDINALNTNGLKLMQRAIEWGVAGSGGGGGGGGGSPPAGPVFEEFAEVNPSTTYNVDVPTPGGTADGDLLIAAIASDEDASDLTAPAGWNTITVTKNGNRVTLGVWWKIASAAEPASHTFTSSSYNMKYGWMMRFTGHDPVTPINATSSFDTGSSRNPPVASATTTVDNTLVLRVGGFDHEDITVDAPGLAGHTPITMDLGGSGLGACAGGSGYTHQPTAGATGTTDFALTGKEEYVTGTIAIAPAP